MWAGNNRGSEAKQCRNCRCSRTLGWRGVASPSRMIPTLNPRFTPGASVTPIADGGWHLEIPSGQRGQYRLAQLDDYSRLSRRAFLWRPPLTPREPRGVALSLRARVSAPDLPGTWGFGLWNDPFGFALGFGNTPGRLPALPNAAWFFHASPENHLSLQPCHCEEGALPDEAIPSQVQEIASGGHTVLRSVQGKTPERPRNDPSTGSPVPAALAQAGQASPANGFFAGTFRSPRWPSPLLARRLPALPNAAWFFHASPENFLSLQPCHCEEGALPDEAIPSQAQEIASGGHTVLRSVQGKTPERPRNDPLTGSPVPAALAQAGQASPANGFFAGTFRSPRWPSPLLAPALLALPFLALRPASRFLRRLASRIVRQDGSAVSVDVTQWHEYSIRWHGDIVFFAVDGAEILRTPLAPRGPLGLVLWIDNQYAAWRPDGSLGYGTLENPSAWLEMDKLHYNCA